MPEPTRRVRCAIYTRKSSEEGLEQDFNSLHAQREACEAYIASQKHEGWRTIPSLYNDGGYSGGSMERPGLQKLMADVASGLIDTVVVYKVDRLTRALSDFAKIVEIFDRHGVSFVSVTQAFNTTTSMGRLTLNVLLSFAQFEREVTGERIRDKIAASKKKGLWMGGFVPIGYEASGRTLVTNETEAETVRTIYCRYLELRSVDALKEDLEERGFRTKLRTGASGRMLGGTVFSRGHLYRILSNRLYAGQISHRKQVYEGQHPAIVSRDTFNAVQATLAENSHRQLVKAHSKSPSLLAGLLFDDTGERLVPTHATKEGRRYRYYVSASSLKSASPRSRSAGPGRERIWRLPAPEVESAVLGVLAASLRDSGWVLDNASSGDGRLANGQAALVRAQRLAGVLESDDAIAKRGLVLQLVPTVVIADAWMSIDVFASAITAGGGSDPLTPVMPKRIIKLERAIALRRRGPEVRLVIDGAGAREPEVDPALVKAVAHAHRWWTDLLNERFATIREIARAYDTDERYVARVIPLAFVSAELTRAIIEGRQRPELTLHRLLKRAALVRDGHEVV